MLYFFVRPIATLGLLFFFRRIHLSHVEHLPRHKPVVLAVNHPTAFLEPCILACWLDRPLYFLVRGDFFDKKVFNFLLRALHMLPVYRQRDKGLRAVKGNYATFRACYEALEQNKTIMILAEGSTEYSKRLRPIKKGTSRVAFGGLASDRNVEEVYVVPLGVTFTDASRFRSEVLISIGEPLLTSDYFDSEEQVQKKGVDQFNQDLYARLAEQMVLIEDPADDELGEGLLDMLRNDLGLGIKGTDRIREEQQFMEPLNQSSPEEKERLHESWNTYRDRREELGLKDISVATEQKNTLLDKLGIILGAPLYGLGWLLNAWPFLFVEWLVGNKVPKLEFKISIRVSVAIFAWLFWWIGVWGVAALAGGPFWIPFFALPLTGIFCVYFTDLYRRWTYRQQWGQLSIEQQQDLKQAREKVFDRYHSIGSSIGD